MQRMDSLDSSTSQIVFKKRIHRPWKSAGLETSEDATRQVENAPFSSEDPAPLLKEYVALNELTVAKSENRLSIGGFLSTHSAYPAVESAGLNNAAKFIDELKGKEQEILLMSHDLKIASAFEQAEKAEQARQQEMIARKAAEEKALYALSQAKHAAEKIYNIEHQVHLERQSRIEEEKIRKFLEEKVQSVLREVEQKNQIVQKEEKARILAENQIKEVLKTAATNEQQIRKDAEEQIQKIVASIEIKTKEARQFSQNTMQQASKRVQLAQDQAEEKIQQLQAKADEKIKKIELEAIEKIRQVQLEADKKIAEAEEKSHFHEKAKLAAQGWIEKKNKAIRQAGMAQQELENKFSLQQHEWEKTRANLQQEITVLTQQITCIQSSSLRLGSEKIQLENELATAFRTMNGMQNIIASEQTLRKILENKLTSSPVRDDEKQRKLVENKICELNQMIATKEIEKSTVEGVLLETTEKLNTLMIILESEKTIKASLEEKAISYIEKIQVLEQTKQKESDLKNLAEQKISVLLKQHENFEQEKLEHAEMLALVNARTLELEMKHEQLLSNTHSRVHELEKKHEIALNKAHDETMALEIKHQESLKAAHMQSELKLNKMQQQLNELEIQLGSERQLRQEAERLKGLEEQARKIAQEKISHAIEQANRTVLSVLGNFTPID